MMTPAARGGPEPQRLKSQQLSSCNISPSPSLGFLNKLFGHDNTNRTTDCRSRHSDISGTLSPTPLQIQKEHKTPTFNRYWGRDLSRRMLRPHILQTSSRVDHSPRRLGCGRRCPLRGNSPAPLTAAYQTSTSKPPSSTPHPLRALYRIRIRAWPRRKALHR